MIFSKANLFKLKKALLSLAEIHTEQGILIYDGDNLEVGMEVFQEGENGLEPAKDGEYSYDNQIIMVEGGKITEIKEKEIEQPEEPVEEVVEEVVEEPLVEETETVEEVVEEPIEGPTVEELQAIIDEQKKMIEDLKAENEELKKKLEEPVAEPAEEEFKKENPVMGEKKIDFSKYIKNRK